MLAKTSIEHEWKDIVSEVESYERCTVAHETRKALPAVKNYPGDIMVHMLCEPQ